MQHRTPKMKRLKLVVIAVQAGYLKKLEGQLTSMFKERLELRSFQLGMLDKERIHADEVVFSAIPNLDKLVKTLFPDIKGFVRADRSVNLVNTGELLSLKGNRRILVVGDHEDVTRKVIRELDQSGFNHDYIPFHPGVDLSTPVDCAITTGELELVPDHINRVINIGLRVISFETMMRINQTFQLGLTPEALNRRYILSLVHVSSNWPVSRKNKYISNWIGTRQDDHPDQQFTEFIAQSPAMKAFIAHARSLCPGNHPIHIDGAIGVGKRRVAIAIHNESKRPADRFFCINCTSEGDHLEKSLFGWEDEGGIFPGLLETAGQGTVCIEEIEAMPPDLQDKLAAFLTDHYLTRSNGRESIPCPARVVTTSTLPLTRAFSEKTIRQTLYHHLSLHVCTMPALAHRKEDFELLIHKFLTQDLNRPDIRIQASALEILKSYSWEGNVQEFYNVIFHLTCLGENKITQNMLPFYIYHSQPETLPATKKDLPDTAEMIRELEKTGFIDEYIQILEVYSRGKQKNQSFGRAVVIERLAENGLTITKQKLRRKQERLNDMGLVRVMKGRAGTTISRTGELFLNQAKKGNT